MAYDKTQQKRIDLGLCKDCGVPRLPDGTTIFCRKCADKNAKRATVRTTLKRKKYSADGLCGQCGSGTVKGTKFKICEDCRRKRREYNLKHAKKRREVFEKRGVCVKCGKVRIGDSRYCKQHWLEFLRRYGFNIEKRRIIFLILVTQNLKCFYTGVELIPGKNATIDHQVPISVDKSLSNKTENIVWCDKRINLMKGDFTYDKFISTCKKITDIHK